MSASEDFRVFCTECGNGTNIFITEDMCDEEIKWLEEEFICEECYNEVCPSCMEQNELCEECKRDWEEQQEYFVNDARFAHSELEPPALVDEIKDLKI